MTGRTKSRFRFAPGLPPGDKDAERFGSCSRDRSRGAARRSRSGERAEFRIRGAQQLRAAASREPAPRRGHFLYASPHEPEALQAVAGHYPRRGCPPPRMRLCAVRGREGRQGPSARAPRAAMPRRRSRRWRSDTWRARAQRTLGRVSGANRPTKPSGLLNADILPDIGHHQSRGRHQAPCDGGCRKGRRARLVRGSRSRAGAHSCDLQLGQRHRLAGRNPTLGLKKRNAGKPRERVLTDTEVRTLWQALDAAAEALAGNS